MHIYRIIKNQQIKIKKYSLEFYNNFDNQGNLKLLIYLNIWKIKKISKTFQILFKNYLNLIQLNLLFILFTKSLNKFFFKCKIKIKKNIILSFYKNKSWASSNLLNNISY